MKRDIKKDLGVFQSKESLEQHQMPGATDGEKLRNPLDNAQNDRFENSNENLLRMSIRQWVQRP